MLHTKVNHLTFFKLCEFLKTNAERFNKERPTLSSVATQASTALGCKIGNGTIAKAKEATGVNWVAHTVRDGAARALRSKVRRQALESLGRCLLELYKQTGATVPLELTETLQTLQGIK